MMQQADMIEMIKDEVLLNLSGAEDNLDVPPTPVVKPEASSGSGDISHL